MEETPKNHVGLIPSGSAIGRAANELEKVAEDKFGLGITETQIDDGPLVRFNYHNHMRTVLEGFDLVKHAQTGSISPPVQISGTLDGAKLTNNIGHVTCGYKITDPRAVDPLTGIPLAISGKFQSRDLCFPLLMAFMKETTRFYRDCIPDFIQYFDQQIVIPATPTVPEMSNFEVNWPADMSAGWKTTGVGGGTILKSILALVMSIKMTLLSPGLVVIGVLDVSELATGSASAIRSLTRINWMFEKKC